MCNFGHVPSCTSNPSDGWAWAGFAGDLIDCAPYLTGVGETIKGIGTAVKITDDVIDAGKAADNVADAAKAADNVADATKASDNVADTTKVVKKTIPDKARDVADYVKSHNGAPPQGYKGGSIYKNEPLDGGQKLPEGVNYKEYDINPYEKGVNRGKERIVIGDDGSVWYTDDHYNTFQKME